MAYVYKHIRLDKDEVFYIGIGADNGGLYKRANSKANRNRWWHSIVNKHGYNIDIIIDDIAWEDALKKEREIISQYKLKRDGGTLVNLTLGGEGALGLVVSDETKKKQSEKKKGKPPPNKGKRASPEVVEKNRIAHLGIVSWNKGIPLSEERKKWHSEIMKGKPSPMKGKKHTEESNRKNSENHLGKPTWNKGREVTEAERNRLIEMTKNRIPWNKGKKMTKEWMSENPQNKTTKPVLQKALDGELIREFASTKQACLELCFSIQSMKFCLRGKLKTYKGFKWEYKKPQ